MEMVRVLGRAALRNFVDSKQLIDEQIAGVIRLHMMSIQDEISHAQVGQYSPRSGMAMIRRKDVSAVILTRKELQEFAVQCGREYVLSLVRTILNRDYYDTFWYEEGKQTYGNSQIVTVIIVNGELVVAS